MPAWCGMNILNHDTSIIGGFQGKRGTIPGEYAMSEQVLKKILKLIILSLHHLSQLRSLIPLNAGDEKVNQYVQ